MDWFSITPLGPGLWQIAEPIGRIEPRFGVATVNMHLIAGSERAALIDTGMGIARLRPVVESVCGLPVIVCNTHFHWDHSAGNDEFDQIAIYKDEVKLLARPQDMASIRAQMAAPEVQAILPGDFDSTQYGFRPTEAQTALSDGDWIDLGGRKLHVLHTPGHSIGHVSYFDEANSLLFSGDTAYRGPMYACFRGGSPAAFAASAQRLAALSERVQMILPGHNETIHGGAFLRELADAAQSALDGRAPLHPPDDFIGGRAARFGDFSVWLPK